NKVKISGSINAEAPSVSLILSIIFADKHGLLLPQVQKDKDFGLSPILPTPLVHGTNMESAIEIMLRLLLTKTVFTAACIGKRYVMECRITKNWRCYAMPL